MSRIPAAPLLSLLLLLCGPPTRPLLAGPLSKLPAPQNVQIHSYNLNSMLSWDPVLVENGMGKVTYEVEFLGRYNTTEWNRINCLKITETQCDFTNAFLDFWRVFLRVRAVNNQLESDWVSTADFQATRDTIVGPPTSVKVTSDYGLLTATFSPPFEKISELKYYVHYWKNNAEKKVKVTRSTSVTLGDLDFWTEYCLQVFAEYMERNGTLSEPVCNTTTATASATAAFTATMTFLVIIVIIMLVGCFFLKRRFSEDIKRWISPPFRIPAHIEEYLNEPKDHVLLAVLEKGSFTEDHYDTLSVVSSD